MPVAKVLSRWIVWLFVAGCVAYAANDFMTYGASNRDAGHQTKTKWPEDKKTAYVQRCTLSLVDQGLPSKRAMPACECVADSLESEFGTEEINAAMRADPRLKGSKIERRLHQALASCDSYTN